MTHSDPKDPQVELRHNVHMKMLEKSESAKDAGELTVIPLGFAVTIAVELIQAREQQLLTEARLSERAWAYKNMRDHGTDPQWIEIARLRMERLINAGKLDNSNPPIQKLDKSVQNKTNDGGNHGD